VSKALIKSLKENPGFQSGFFFDLIDDLTPSLSSSSLALLHEMEKGNFISVTFPLSYFIGERLGVRRKYPLTNIPLTL